MSGTPRSKGAAFGSEIAFSDGMNLRGGKTPRMDYYGHEPQGDREPSFALYPFGNGTVDWNTEINLPIHGASSTVFLRVMNSRSHRKYNS